MKKEETVEVVNSEELDRLREEADMLRSENGELKREIEHIRTDNSVLKETIVRMQIKNVGLME